MFKHSNYARNIFPLMPHHGKILKRTVERKGLTQDAAGQLLGYATRQAFVRLYEKEEFNEKLLSKVTAAFDIPRSQFFPEHSNIVTGDANAVGNGNRVTIGSLEDCQKELAHWKALAKANDDRARAFEQLAEERKEIIDMLKKN